MKKQKKTHLAVIVVVDIQNLLRTFNRSKSSYKYHLVSKKKREI